MIAQNRFSELLILVLGFAPAARPAQVFFTITGTVQHGTNGYSSGDAKAFDREASKLDGESFTLMVALDDSEGTSASTLCSGGPLGYSYIQSSGVASSVAASLRIGNSVFPLNSYPLAGLSWKIARSTCAVTDSISLEHAEYYGSGYTGGAGIGTATLVPLSPFSSTDWRAPVSVDLVPGKIFQFNIELYPPDGSSPKYALGELNPLHVTISGPLTCAAGTLAPAPQPGGVPHGYVALDRICSPSASSACTLNNVFSELLLHPTIVPEPNPVSTCNTRYIPATGTVLFYVEPGTLSITNVTLTNHILFPGRVIRSVIQQDGDIYIQTTGTGTGSFSSANAVVGEYLIWPVTDALIAQQF